MSNRDTKNNTEGKRVREINKKIRWRQRDMREGGREKMREGRLR